MPSGVESARVRRGRSSSSSSARAQGLAAVTRYFVSRCVLIALPAVVLAGFAAGPVVAQEGGPPADPVAADPAAAIVPGVPSPVEETLVAEGSATPGTPAPAQAPDTAAGEQPAGFSPHVESLHGFVDTRYRYRSTDEGLDRQEDQDFYSTLYLTGRGMDDHVSVQLLTRGTVDIDGGHEAEIFGGLFDTYDWNAHANVYKAYVDVQRLGPVRRIRLGRQVVGEAELPIRFDGALFDARFRRFGVIAYGGVPAHLYEGSPRGDWIAGSALEFGLPRFRVRFDYVHVEDRQSSSVRHDDDLFQLSATWLFLEGWKLYGRASTFEGRSQLLVGRILFRDAAHDLAASFGGDVRLGSFRDLAIEFSPFDEIIGRLEDYWQVSGTVSKGFGEHVSVLVGGWARELFNEDDEAPFNHNFQRYYATVDLRDLGLKGLTLSGTGGLYIDGGAHVLDLGGEIAKAFGDLTLSLGTAYSLYQISDEVTLEERERVRTFYARLDWAPRLAHEGFWQQPLHFRLGYRAEWDDVEMYHVLDAGVRFVF